MLTRGSVLRLAYLAYVLFGRRLFRVFKLSQRR